MNYIELIGPPAVGKTTLLKNLAEIRDKKTQWKTYKEAVFDIVERLEWSQMNTSKRKFLYLLNKGNITSYKKFGICNKIINELTEGIPNTIQQKYEYFIEAKQKTIQSIELNISPSNKYSLLSWHIQSLQKIFILETFQYASTVLFTEGPLKTHYGLSNIDLMDIRSDTLPKAVIYCTLDVQQNLNRIKTRKEQTGKTSKIHNVLMNQEPLEHLVDYTHKVAERNFTFIKSIGIPTIEVDLTSPLSQTNLHQLSQFIETYSAMQKNMMFNYAVV